jgi:hypothetical protein
MLEVEDRTFVRQAVRLDGRRFVGCRFEACRLVYGGGDVEVEDCTFDDCTWDVQDAAANTVRLFEQVRRSGAHVPTDPAPFSDESAPRDDRRTESLASPTSGERSTARFDPARTSIGHQLADYAEWAVVAVVAAALLLTLFLRS